MSYAYFGYKSFIRYVFFKYFFLACGLHFYFLKSILHIKIILIKSNLSVFFFHSLVFSVVYKHIWQISGQLDLLLCFFSKSFIDLPFIFWFIIYFELIFMKGVRFISTFKFLHMISNFPALFVKKTTFLHCIVFMPLSKICWLYYTDSFLFIDPCVSFSQYYTSLINVDL